MGTNEDLGSTDGKNWYCPECDEPMLIPHAWDGTVLCLACGYDSQGRANRESKGL